MSQPNLLRNSTHPLAADLESVFRQTSPLWEDLRGKKIFITGGTGFFGKWLLGSFLYANQKLKLKASLTILTRRPQVFQLEYPKYCSDKSCRLLEGDVKTFKFPEGEYSYVIHAATDANVLLFEREPLNVFHTMIDGTERMLEFAARCKVKKFLLMSSGAIYGKQPASLSHISEEFSGTPDLRKNESVYGEGKRAAELLCSIYGAKFNFEVKIARCFTFVGPYLPLDLHYAIGNFIRDGMNGNSIIVKGDGTPYRSYLYASDLAAWLWTILLRGKNGRPYNVGSAKEVQIARLAEIIAALFKPKRRIIIEGARQTPNSKDRYVPSVERAFRELGLTVTVNLKDAIKKTIAWHLHQKSAGAESPHPVAIETASSESS